MHCGLYNGLKMTKITKKTCQSIYNALRSRTFQNKCYMSYKTQYQYNVKIKIND